MLNPCAAAQLLAMQGETIRWFEALPCDCRDPRDPSYYNRDCPKCEFGHVYRERVLAAGVKALVHSERHQFLHAEWGFMSVGDLYVTTMPDEIRLGDLDRVVLVERKLPAKEIVQRGAEGVADALMQEFPLEVLTVADGDTEFVVGEDFSFDEEEGAIAWLEEGARPDGQVYTVHYLYAPVFWYTGSGMTAPRPMPGWPRQGPQTGRLELKHPQTEG